VQIRVREEGQFHGVEGSAKVEHAVKDAAENVDADGEGIDVVHADMVGKEIGEYHAAENKRHNRDANTSRGSKEPDEENEQPNA